MIAYETDGVIDKDVINGVTGSGDKIEPYCSGTANKLSGSLKKLSGLSSQPIK